MVEKAGTNEMRTTIPDKECDALEDFYQWTKKIGHYHASEAVERYRKMQETNDE